MVYSNIVFGVRLCCAAGTEFTLLPGLGYTCSILGLLRVQYTVYSIRIPISSMSAHPAISTESYREKALRKFKQQPLVPVGAAATTVALVIAMTKMRKGQSHSFNNWLRVRIVAQGLTVAAVVAGSWTYGVSTPAPQLEIAAAQEKAAQERAAFEERLRLAEEITRAESGSVPAAADVRTPPSTALPTTESPPPSTTSGSWQSWWRRNGSKNGTEKSS